MRSKQKPFILVSSLTMIFILMVALAACSGGNTPSANNTMQDEPAVNNSTSSEPTENSTMPEDTTPPTDEPVQEPAEADTASTDTDAETTATVSFSADVLPIIESRCINCHGGDRTEGELVLRSYDDMMAGGESGAVITPGDATNSLLVELVTNQKMPKRGPKLTPPQVELITTWVNEGAQNN